MDSKTNLRLQSSSPHCTISIDMEATQYLTAAGRLSKYISLPWYRGWQNSTVFISQNTIIADPQLIWELPFPKTCTEQMWGSARERSHYNSANFQTVLHAWICACLFFLIYSVWCTLSCISFQGDRGFDGLPGLLGNKGHRVSWFC